MSEGHLGHVSEVDYNMQGSRNRFAVVGAVVLVAGDAVVAADDDTVAADALMMTLLMV
jgi:hypothetical protein